MKERIKLFAGSGGNLSQIESVVNGWLAGRTEEVIEIIDIKISECAGDEPFYSRTIMVVYRESGAADG